MGVVGAGGGGLVKLGCAVQFSPVHRAVQARRPVASSRQSKPNTQDTPSTPALLSGNHQRRRRRPEDLTADDLCSSDPTISPGDIRQYYLNSYVSRRPCRLVRPPIQSSFLDQHKPNRELKSSAPKLLLFDTPELSSSLFQEAPT